MCLRHLFRSILHSEIERTKTSNQNEILAPSTPGILSGISRNWTSISPICVEFLDSVSQQIQNWNYFAAVDIRTGISLEMETKYIAGSNAFDPKRFYKKKVSKRLSYFHHLSKKVGPKMIHFYCMKAYRDWLQIQDPQILTVGSPIESKDVWLSGQLFWSVRGSKRAVLILSLRLFPSDQKHSTRQCI